MSQKVINSLQIIHRINIQSDQMNLWKKIVIKLYLYLLDIKNKLEFEIINSDKRKIIKVKIKGLKIINEIK